jgi:hypothetical protein
MSNSLEQTEWDLKDFQRVKLVGTNEVLLSSTGDDLLIFTPWWEDAHPDAMSFVADLGFKSITEVGSIQNYTIPEVECDDWDFFRLAPMHVELQDPRDA